MSLTESEFTILVRLASQILPSLTHHTLGLQACTTMDPDSGPHACIALSPAHICVRFKVIASLIIFYPVSIPDSLPHCIFPLHSQHLVGWSSKILHSKSPWASSQTACTTWQDLETGGYISSYLPCGWKVEARGWETQSHPWLHIKFEASLGEVSVRFCIN